MRPTQLALHKDFVAQQPVAVGNHRTNGGTHTQPEVAFFEDDVCETIDRKNGWHDAEHPSEAQTELEEQLREFVIRGCVTGYGEIFYFCYSGASGALMPVNSKKNLEVAFRRFVALTRLLFPEVLQDKSGPLSQARVAELLGKSPTYIADVGTRFSENWKFYSRVQKTKSEKEASRMARLAFLSDKAQQPKVQRKPNGKRASVGLCHKR